MKELMYFEPSIGRSLPGRYVAGREKQERARIPLIDGMDASYIASIWHGSWDAMFDKSEQQNQDRRHDWQLRANAWLDLDRLSQKIIPRPQLPSYLDFDWEGLADPQRFMCATGFPALKLRDNTVKWGVGCTQCLREYNLAPDEDLEVDCKRKSCRTLYSLEGFVSHVVGCEAARQ